MKNNENTGLTRTSLSQTSLSQTSLTRRSVLKRGGGILAGGTAFTLAGCAAQNGPGPQVQQPVNSGPITGAIGNGPVRVGLLLPMTATGNAGATGLALKNAAELAIREIDPDGITVMPIDTAGTAEGARNAANQAVQQGARMIIGPLFSAEVVAVGQVASAASIPVMAFSSDPNAAGRGVYLLSFLAESDIDRIVFYSAQQNRRSFAAILPENAYGAIVEGALRQAASRNGGSVIQIERYKPDTQSIGQAVTRIAQIAGGTSPRIDALLLPDGAAAMPFLTRDLAAAGVDTNRVKILGSGQWDDPKVLGNAYLAGAWYAAPPPNGWAGFVPRYQATFNAAPPRIATLSYDAATLASVLARRSPNQPFPTQTLQSQTGFNGTDGIFRFTTDGRNDRGLAVLEVAPPASRVVQAGARDFSGGGF